MREAADRLGVTPDAIRQRIKRETIEHEKGEDGLTYVYVTPSATVTDASADTDNSAVTEALLRTYEDQIEFLRRELERNDAILLNMTEGLKQLEAPREAPESPVTPADGPGSSSSTPPEQEKRSWLARFFGL